MACQKCGNCCSRGVGYVFISDKKYEKYKKFQDFPLEDLGFVKAIVVEGPCPYLNKNNLCDIYDNRPIFCRVGRCIKSLILPAKKHNSLESKISVNA